MQKQLSVAVAVIRREDGSILFAKRPLGKACAGEWEFPGGKIEAGETPLQALHREIEEELAINISHARPWITVRHSYPHAQVLLHFFIVSDWSGKEHGREGQQLSWQDISNISISPLLAANAPVIRALGLPDVYSISCANALGEEEFLRRLPNMIDKGMRLLQIREKEMTACQLKRFVDQLLTITLPAGVITLISSSMPAEQRKRFSGIHLTSSHLMELDNRPDFELVAASCHNREELEKAIQLELDFAVLSPVNRTPTHPEASPLGKKGFAEIIEECPIPVYALGGMSRDQLHELQSLGAHGIAMMRNAWL